MKATRLDLIRLVTPLIVCSAAVALSTPYAGGSSPSSESPSLTRVQSEKPYAHPARAKSKRFTAPALLEGAVKFAVAGEAEGTGDQLSSARAAAVSFINTPAVLPRDTPLGNYSPLVSIQYDGLGAETYTLRVHLLETDTGSFLCGCSPSSQMWCNAAFTINNRDGTNSSGRIVSARPTDIHNRVNFLWVADLYNQAGTLVSHITRPATSTLNRAPVLNQIGDKSGVAGQSVDFTVSASDPEGDAVTLSAQNLPPGATFNNATGQFHWQPSAPGTFSSIEFVATQGGANSLSDAELISIQVGSQPPPNVLAFSAAAYKTGEGGPAVLTVTRSNGSAGAVTVSYSTVGGTATSDTDFTGVSGGTLSFAAGETAKTIRVPIINDPTAEVDETFQVQLSAPTNGATLGAPSAATATIVDDDNPQLAGRWGNLMTWPSVPIHTHLLPTGKVMFWDRHNHGASPVWDGNPYLWDPAAPTVFTPLPLPGWDIFCSGHTFMADGRLLIAGGHINDAVGDPKASVYNPFTNSWARLPNMNAGRWYPTTTTLANGDVLVVAGTRLGYDDINPLPQVWETNTGNWRNLTGALSGAYPAWPDFYPFMYLAPNGKVFVAGPQQTARYLDTTGAGTSTDVANSSVPYRDYASSVMYGDGKVMIAGGNPRDPNPSAPTIIPSSSVEVINLNSPTPAWRLVAPMSVGRRHLNTTLLPDGKVLVTGGSSAPGFDDPAGAVLYAELWDPGTEASTPLAAQTRYRGYHSVALLLPDARVLVAGGGHPDPPGGTAENNAEIYSPPYLFKGTRPAITSAPTAVTYGQTFHVQTPDAAGVTSVSWIRLSSVTHAFNQNQRINHLSFSVAAGGLNVTAPSSPNLCPPGHYMLFILNGNGVPSVAKIVQITDTTLQFSAGSQTVGEASGSATLSVTRAGNNAGTVTVDYNTSEGTAAAGTDYVAASGTLTFASGETSKTISIVVNDDNLDEPDESFGVSLSNATGGAGILAPVSAALTITDNDSPPPTLVNVALAANGATVAASSTLDAGRSALAAINGDRRGVHWGTDPSTGSGWHDATNDTYPDWIEVTFTGPRTLREVNVFSVQDAYLSPDAPTETLSFTKYGVTAMQIEYWTGTAWAVLPGASLSVNNKVWAKFTFPPTSTSKVRVVVNAALAGHARITEVEAWAESAPPPTPSRINHALAANGATVAASSTLDAGRSALAAINGDRRGVHWGSAPATGSGWHDATANAYPDWLEVSFAGPISLDEVGVFSVQDTYLSPVEPTESLTFTKYGVTGMTVEYWTGSGWAAAPSGTLSANNKVWAKFTFPAVSTTKVRVLVNTALASHARITEVEAWGISSLTPPRVNHALAANGGTAAASSTVDANRAASAAINGDRRGLHWGSEPSTGSGWHDATADAYPDWLEITFNGTKSLTEVNVFTLQNNFQSPSEPTESMTFTQYGIQDFDVEYWTGSAWAAVPGGQVVNNNLVWRKFVFPALSTNRIRVLVKRGAAGFARITEVEAY